MQAVNKVLYEIVRYSDIFAPFVKNFTQIVNVILESKCIFTSSIYLFFFFFSLWELVLLISELEIFTKYF